jgi:hypothetical protein
MAFYRKKPIVIEAFQFRYEDGAHLYWPSWFREAMLKEKGTEGGVYIHANGLYVIWTLEGILEISPHDFVIKGVKGELYPCKPDIFTATYEAVDNSQQH